MTSYFQGRFTKGLRPLHFK